MTDEAQGSAEQAITQPAVTFDIGQGELQHQEMSKTFTSDVPEQGSEEKSTEESTEWWWDENTKGVGEKPAWFNEKTFKYVAKQAEAHPELRKKLGEQLPVPDDYSIDLGEELKDFKFDDKDQTLQEFMKLGKEAKLPQEHFTKALKLFAEYKKQEITDWNQYITGEAKKIGADAPQKLQDIRDWLSQNYGEEAGKVLGSSINSKALYDAFNEMRSKTGYPKSPATAPRESKNLLEEQAQKRMSDPRYGYDQTFDNETTELFRKIAQYK